MRPFFFFSSRRRHTILTCDWSSDVCSSDLDMAISWEYWPPQSRTRTGRSSAAGSGSGTTAALPAIVRRFLRDRHVVRVALAQPGRGDARSEERRVGEEGRWRGWECHEKKKK